jgi:hypothetical protein
MIFKKGRYRFVFVFPQLGIAVKLPAIRLFKAIGTLIGHVIHLRFRRLLWNMARPIGHGFEGCQDELFGGVWTNWNEFWFYQQTRNEFLQPTYFSLFGLFNIQKAGRPCDLDDDDLWFQIKEIVGDDVYDDAHHFRNSSNFCSDNGKIKMLDYGNKKTHRIIAEHGKKIFESFDPKHIAKVEP